MSLQLEFVVAGEARPAGALQIGSRRDGTRFLHHRSSGDLRKWKNAVIDEAESAMAGQPATTRAVRVSLDFYVRRPKSDFGTGRNVGLLKPLVAAYPIRRSKGDIDKLVRACLDAFSDVVFVDDSQVVELRARKLFAVGDPFMEAAVSLMDDELDVADAA